MKPEQIKTADRMKPVKVSWGRAPAGPKKNAALKHYQTAEKAHTVKSGAQTNEERGAAPHAFA